MRLCLLLLVHGVVAAVTKKPKSIILIVADDLGWDDLGAYNGKKTSTPNINGLVQGGITLTDYYTFKICSPSRAAMLTGRYPWGAGFYDMSYDIMHCTSNFTSLPSMLQGLGFATHALGKWDVGFMEKECGPIGRGFDTFFGYYDACQADYWYHNASGGYPLTAQNCHREDGGPVDFSNSTVHDACTPAETVHGIYNRELFSREAARLIRAHDQSKPMYMYLAFMNIHDACAPGKDKLGLQAPKSTVDLYATTKEDSYKVTGAMITELDIGVGEVLEALRDTGMWSNTVVALVSDNGGPLQHSANAPLRGGKHTFWEGGVRVRAIVGGAPEVIPAARRGVEWTGLAHSADWYHTFVEGIAAGRVPEDTGPRPSDGFNLWDALMSGAASPRTEVVHQVTNSYFDEGFAGIRMGEMKFMIGNPGDSRIVSWPELEAHAVPLGLTGAVVEPGTDHVRAPDVKTAYADHLDLQEQLVGGEILSSPNDKVLFRMQKNGNLVLITTDNHVVWTSKTANHDGASALFQSDGRLVVRGNASEGHAVLWSGEPQDGASRLEVRDDCDVAVVDEEGRVLWSLNTTCPSKSLGSAGSLCTPYCLFNLTEDVAETHDLAMVEDPVERKKWDALAQEMRERLEYHGSTGGPHAFLWDTKTYRTKKDDLCAATVASGFLEPLDCAEVSFV